MNKKLYMEAWRIVRAMPLDDQIVRAKALKKAMPEVSFSTCRYAILIASISFKEVKT